MFVLFKKRLLKKCFTYFFFVVFGGHTIAQIHIAEKATRRIGRRHFELLIYSS